MSEARLRYRVVTVAAPWVAPDDAPCGQPEAFKDTMLFECFQSILRAGRCISAAGTEQGAQAPLVYFDENDKRDAKYLQKFIHCTRSAGHLFNSFTSFSKITENLWRSVGKSAIFLSV